MRGPLLGNAKLFDRSKAFVICEEVARAYGIQANDLLGPRGKPIVSEARHVAMALMDGSDREISKFFNRERSTTSWAQKVIRDYLDVYPEFRKRFEELKRTIEKQAP
jgi:chromosomal replication initiation ATPase DnaA